jgi:hypothetical protein
MEIYSKISELPTVIIYNCRLGEVDMLGFLTTALLHNMSDVYDGLRLRTIVIEM